MPLYDVGCVLVAAQSASSREIHRTHRLLTRGLNKLTKLNPKGNMVQDYSFTVFQPTQLKEHRHVTHRQHAICGGASPRQCCANLHV